jgi:hypothetical protein
MPPRFTRNVLLVLAACALAGVFAVAVAGAAAPQHVRLGRAPSRPSGSSVVGAVASTTALQVTVMLKPRDPAALEDYATAVSTPGSGVYHRYLTVAGFRQRFAPTSSQITAVLASLRAHGLRPGQVTANGLSIPVRATAGALGRAFSTSFDRVRLRGGREAFTNAQAPSFDSSVAGIVQGAVGLNNLVLPRPLGLRGATSHAAGRASPHVVTGGPQPCSAASSAAPSNSAYTTDQIASAYGFSGLYGAGDEGAGQTVAIYELEPNFQSDIPAFKSCYGITTGTATYVKVDGGAGTASAANGDGIETELDIENVVGLAPKANVVVYQGPNNGSGPLDVYSKIVNDDSAQVISTSWGLCEPFTDPTDIQSENTLFQEAATQGQSVFAASGDSGSEDCGDNSLAVDDPASQPFVTGAGGTSLSLGPPPAESVWNDQCSGGSCGGGGGISTLWTMHSDSLIYQSSAPGSLNVVNSNSSGAPCGAPSGTYCREVPDVSADGDPSTGYLIYWDGGWTGIGGTSGAAPLWAGLTADANESPVCNGTAVGFVNPVLYTAAATDYSSDFNDVTSGNNDITGTNGGLYPAGSGYDMASGLGTPNAYRLAAAMCGDLVDISNPGPRTDHLTSSNASVQLQISATDSDSNTLTYSATGLPPGVSIDASSGLISGDPTTAGTYGVAVTASDAKGAAGQVTFVWTITTPVTVDAPPAQSSVVGVPISGVQVTGSSGLTYSAPSGLPPGLSISSSGLITGTPTATGTYQVTVQGTDGTFTDSKQFTWIVNPVTVTVTSPGNQIGIVGIATTLQAHASDNDGGGIVYSATGLPPGLSINASSGLVSGTPAAAGAYAVTLTATDGSTSQSSAFTWTISSATVAVANPGNQTGRVGSRTSLKINAADDNGGALSYNATGLPPGLTISGSTGLITGVPSAAGRFAVTVAAVDGGSVASTQFSWTVAGPPRSPSGSLSGIVDGKPKLSLSISAGANAPGIKKLVLILPSGLTFTGKTGKGIALTGPGGSRLKGFKLKGSGGRLTITLGQAVRHVTIALSTPAIRASGGLISRVRQRSAGKLALRLTATDAGGFASTLALKLKPS